MDVKRFILAIFVIILISCLTYAKCPTISDVTDEQQRCGAVCMKMQDLIAANNCVNDCNAKWFRDMEALGNCTDGLTEQTQHDKEVDFGKDQPKPEPVNEEQPKIEYTIEQYKEQFGTLGQLNGNIEYRRNKMFLPVPEGFIINPGDTLLTGDDGAAQIDYANKQINLGANTRVGFGIVNTNPPSVETPGLDWDLDPNYKHELDEMSFWKELFWSMVEFHHDNPPKYLYTCAKAIGGDIGSTLDCPFQAVMFVYNGFAWFNKKLGGEDYSSELDITPSIGVWTDGTEYTIQVDDDGTTTVTTIEGKVYVIDLKSLQAVQVLPDNKITVPVTQDGFSQEELQQMIILTDSGAIDKWWEDYTAKTIQKRKQIFLVLVFIVVMISALISTLIKRRMQRQNKK